MPPTSRNAACRCGSGKRYKDCHGALGNAAAADSVSALTHSVAAALRSALERLADDDPAAAEVICRDVLAQFPDHPEALRILGRSEYDRGHARESLRLALRAARAMQTQALDPSAEFLVWADLNFMFTQALPGLDSAFASKKRFEYETRRRSPASASPAHPLVGVVLVVPGAVGGAA
ncbi:MAG: SEC-C domain-containing protein, partial [Aromatoleum sp.]|nr:SEC-C domain-containing protein [Aromatoleum sp.]